MIRHVMLGSTPFARLRALVGMMQSGVVTLGGNQPSRVYGRLDCRAGKRMKSENRVFFKDEAEAVGQGFRPCAVCLPTEYRVWRESR